MAGQYVGFLRDTARHYREQGLSGALPELVELLALNADLGRTGGATIGLERDDHLSTLHQVHSSEGLDQARFEELLEGFMAIGEDLRHEILRLQTVAATNRAEPVAARPEGDPPLGTRV